MEIENLLQNVVVAAFATVGLIEFLKNFIKVEKKWIYALLMIPVSALCFFFCITEKEWGIGAMLTIGMTQLCYQTIVQTFQAVVKMFGNKAAGVADNIKEEKE